MEVTLLLLPMKLSLSEQVGRHPYCGVLVKFSSKALLGGREKGTSCLSGGSGGNGSDTVWRGEGCDKTVVMSARLLCFFSSLQEVEGHSDPAEKGRESELPSCFAKRMAKEECCFVFFFSKFHIFVAWLLFLVLWLERNFFPPLGVFGLLLILGGCYLLQHCLITFLLPWQTPWPSQIIEENHLIWGSGSQRVRVHDHNSGNLAAHRLAWH